MIRLNRYLTKHSWLNELDSHRTHKLTLLLHKFLFKTFNILYYHIFITLSKYTFCLYECEI
jgi:hypothetical protein